MKDNGCGNRRCSQTRPQKSGCKCVELVRFAQCNEQCEQVYDPPGTFGFRNNDFSYSSCDGTPCYEGTAKSDEPIDILGGVMLATGIGATLFALSSATRSGLDPLINDQLMRWICHVGSVCRSPETCGEPLSSFVAISPTNF